VIVWWMLWRDWLLYWQGHAAGELSKSPAYLAGFYDGRQK
jgi:hypothetical protein